MEKFCAIIPDRGDRPELTDHCFRQIDRMFKKPDEVYHVNHKPNTSGFDLVDRVFRGASMARQDGFDWCFIIENDDYYPSNYFDRFTPYLDKYDFLGEEKSTYYNLQNLTFRTFEHKCRSSLFTTAFRISALNNFEWPGDDTVFLDINLWKYARHKRRKFIDTGAVGIKHGLGLCGGKGHKMRMPGYDRKLEWLESHTDEMSFRFYTNLSKRIMKETMHDSGTI